MVEARDKQFSDYVGNAEVDIDYEHKKVTFIPVNKQPNEWLTYFTNNYYLLMGLLTGLIALLSFTHKIDQGEPTLWGTLQMSYLALCILGWIILFGYISIIVHTYSATARKYIGHTNSILGGFNIQHIQLEDVNDTKHFKGGYIVGNNIIITDYNIGYWEWNYQGPHTITHVTTKSIEPRNHDGEHFNFIAIITFNEHDSPIPSHSMDKPIMASKPSDASMISDAIPSKNSSQRTATNSSIDPEP